MTTVDTTDTTFVLIPAGFLPWGQLFSPALHLCKSNEPAAFVDASLHYLLQKNNGVGLTLIDPVIASESNGYTHSVLWDLLMTSLRAMSLYTAWLYPSFPLRWNAHTHGPACAWRPGTGQQQPLSPSPSPCYCKCDALSDKSDKEGAACHPVSEGQCDAMNDIKGVAYYRFGSKIPKAPSILCVAVVKKQERRIRCFPVLLKKCIQKTGVK